MVGVEVRGAAVDARFDAVLGVGDDGGVAGDGAGVSAVEREALADAQGGASGGGRGRLRLVILEDIREV